MTQLPQRMSITILFYVICIIGAHYFIYFQMNDILLKLEYFIIACHSISRERVCRLCICFHPFLFLLFSHLLSYICIKDITDCGVGPTHFVHSFAQRKYGRLLINSTKVAEMDWQREIYQTKRTKYLMILNAESRNIPSYLKKYRNKQLVQFVCACVCSFIH